MKATTTTRQLTKQQSDPHPELVTVRTRVQLAGYNRRMAGAICDRLADAECDRVLTAIDDAGVYAVFRGLELPAGADGATKPVPSPSADEAKFQKRTQRQIAKAIREQHGDEDDV